MSKRLNGIVDSGAGSCVAAGPGAPAVFVCGNAEHNQLQLGPALVMFELRAALCDALLRHRQQSRSRTNTRSYRATRSALTSPEVKRACTRSCGQLRTNQFRQQRQQAACLDLFRDRGRVRGQPRRSRAKRSTLELPRPVPLGWYLRHLSQCQPHQRQQASAGACFACHQGCGYLAA